MNFLKERRLLFKVETEAETKQKDKVRDALDWLEDSDLLWRREDIKRQIDEKYWADHAVLRGVTSDRIWELKKLHTGIIWKLTTQNRKKEDVDSYITNLAIEEAKKWEIVTGVAVAKTVSQRLFKGFSESAKFWKNSLNVLRIKSEISEKLQSALKDELGYLQTLRSQYWEAASILWKSLSAMNVPEMKELEATQWFIDEIVTSTAQETESRTDNDQYRELITLDNNLRSFLSWADETITPSELDKLIEKNFNNWSELTDRIDLLIKGKKIDKKQANFFKLIAKKLRKRKFYNGNLFNNIGENLNNYYVENIKWAKEQRAKDFDRETGFSDDAKLKSSIKRILSKDYVKLWERISIGLDEYTLVKKEAKWEHAWIYLRGKNKKYHYIDTSNIDKAWLKIEMAWFTTGDTLETKRLRVGSWGWPKFKFETV